MVKPWSSEKCFPQEHQFFVVFPNDVNKRKQIWRYKDSKVALWPLIKGLRVFMSMLSIKDLKQHEVELIGSDDYWALAVGS